MNYNELSEEELTDKIQWFNGHSWEANAAEAEGELERRERIKNGDLPTTDELTSGDVTNEEIAEEMYQYAATGSGFGGRGDQETANEVFEAVSDLTKFMPEEINERFGKKIDSRGRTND